MTKQQPLKKQMIIVTAPCWKCEEPFKLALIYGNVAIDNGQVYGPEKFTNEEIELAETSGVTIKMHKSATRKDEYLANTCTHCNAFLGQFYHFEYFCGAIQYGDYSYKEIDL